MIGAEVTPKYKQPEGWDFGLLPGELTGTSAGIGRCQLHLVGVGIGFSNNHGAEVRSPSNYGPLFAKSLSHKSLERFPCRRWLHPNMTAITFSSSDFLAYFAFI